jgi:hypothetical protein
VIAALLQAAKIVSISNESDRNPYWTIVNYFNSLRELGNAATLVRADIREYLSAMHKRKKLTKKDDGDSRRFIYRAEELTSRIPNGEIPQVLQALEINYPNLEQESRPVDVCLASNMISVGMDVPRLGLMTVIGQPKTTSEYIQATSRVGRSQDGPGLVVTIYNPSKPRDRSHYEHFHTYHSRIYTHVEPTSVTPFSTPVRERALHALLVGFVRYFGESEHKISPQPLPNDTFLEQIKSIIVDRVNNIDPDELEHTLALLETRINEWERYYPPKYTAWTATSEEMPLMYPAGLTPAESWRNKPWPTPTSMRNVDSSCEASTMNMYPESKE